MTAEGKELWSAVDQYIAKMLIPADPALTLDAVPKDPQDGKPLRYQRRPDGVVVYWLGEDGTDDGGMIDRLKPLRYLTKGTDQGVELWDVGRRRQPPPKVPPPAAPDAP